MIERKGNLFDYEGEAIGHGVNCKGLMGAGIARAFAETYPSMYDSYKIHCNNKDLKPGGVFLYRAPNGKMLVNLASQNTPGADAKYGWLAESATQAISDLLDLGIHQLAIPRIGCGIGGLDWNAVEVILQLIEQTNWMIGNDFEFVVYTLEEPTP